MKTSDCVMAIMQESTSGFMHSTESEIRLECNEHAHILRLLFVLSMVAFSNVNARDTCVYEGKEIYPPS